MRDYQTDLTCDDLRARFRYVKSTGHFIRKVPVFGGPGGVVIQDRVGTIAGSIHKDGYVYIAIQGRLYLAHRLAVLWVTGSWPAGEVDHKNGNRSDNRWSNLRQASTQQNRMNSLGQRKRAGPYPGVYEVERRRGPSKFCAQIKFNGEVIYLGVHATPELARKARLSAERKLFGQFAGSASRGSP